MGNCIHCQGSIITERTLDGPVRQCLACGREVGAVASMPVDPVRDSDSYRGHNRKGTTHTGDPARFRGADTSIEQRRDHDARGRFKQSAPSTTPTDRTWPL